MCWVGGIELEGVGAGGTCGAGVFICRRGADHTLTARCGAVLACVCRVRGCCCRVNHGRGRRGRRWRCCRRFRATSCPSSWMHCCRGRPQNGYRARLVLAEVRSGCSCAYIETWMRGGGGGVYSESYTREEEEEEEEDENSEGVSGGGGGVHLASMKARGCRDRRARRGGEGDSYSQDPYICCLGRNKRHHQRIPLPTLSNDASPVPWTGSGMEEEEENESENEERQRGEEGEEEEKPSFQTQKAHQLP